MAWEPDRRSNFFFSPPAHLCAVTYMTEISLIVTLNNQFNSTQLNTFKQYMFTLSMECYKGYIQVGFHQQGSVYELNVNDQA